MSNTQDQWLRIREFALAFKAGHGVTLPPGEQEITDNLPTERELTATGIHGAYGAYLSNKWRLMCLASTPVDAFCHGEKLQQLRVEHAEELSRGKSFDEIVKEWLAGPRFSFSAVDTSHVASMFAPEFVWQASPSAIAFCGSLVIQAWAMFECLAEDLWRAATKTNNRLAELRGTISKPERKRRRHNPPANVQLTPQQDEENFVLDQHGKKPGFRSLMAIRVSYDRAFDTDHQDISDALSDVRLRFVAAVRNVLTHKAGKVDSEFHDQVRDVPSLPPIQSGDVFPLTGRIAAAICDDTVCCSAKLIRGVHEWLKSHP